jgi:hypothetical protein
MDPVRSSVGKKFIVLTAALLAICATGYILLRKRVNLDGFPDGIGERLGMLEEEIL